MLDYENTKPIYVYTRAQLFLHDIWLWVQGAVFGAAFTGVALFLIWPKK